MYGVEGNTCLLSKWSLVRRLSVASVLMQVEGVAATEPLLENVPRVEFDGRWRHALLCLVWSSSEVFPLVDSSEWDKAGSKLTIKIIVEKNIQDLVHVISDCVSHGVVWGSMLGVYIILGNYPWISIQSSNSTFITQDNMCRSTAK